MAEPLRQARRTVGGRIHPVEGGRETGREPVGGREQHHDLVAGEVRRQRLDRCDQVLDRRLHRSIVHMFVSDDNRKMRPRSDVPG